MSAASSLAEQDWFWLEDEEEVWVPVRLVSSSGGTVQVEDERGRTYPAIEAERFAELPRVHPSARKGIPDMVHLDDLRESDILHTLRTRFANNEIYTFISSILVSVNPFRRIPGMYGEKVMERVRAAAGAGPDAAPPPPHCYNVGAAAYSAFVSTGKDQCVVVSGESGAGKTEATKFVLSYLSFASSHVQQRQQEEEGVAAGAPAASTEPAAEPAARSLIEQRIVEANPVLEAFGNAQTVRNNNSSRFGKYCAVQMDSQYRVTGATISHYLLEKSRVVSQAPGERNYHIFYQLVAAAGAGMFDLASLELGGADEYRYLTGGGRTAIPGVSDVDEARATWSAMKVIGFTEAEIGDVVRTLAAVLLVGDAEIAAASEEKDEATVDSSPGSPVARAAAMLGVDAGAMAKCLCGQKRMFGRDELFVPFKSAAAAANRDAFAKHVYSFLFDWVVRKVNRSLHTASFVFGTVGVLDIFGFEIFELNSLEQLCINFANEKLQKHFNHFVFVEEQQLYRAEGLGLDYVTFNDNTERIELIEGGLLPMLDEALSVPDPSDGKYLEGLHARFRGDENYSEPRFGGTTFVVRHYAGDVSYDVDGFLDKNRDRLEDGLVKLARTSDRAFVRELVDEEGAEEAGAAKKQKQHKKRSSAAAAKKRATLGGRFKGQLAALMGIMDACDPHFIRCIKPNAQQSPSAFDSADTLRQLRYAGVRDVVRIRQMGFPVRLAHRDFCQRYTVLIPPTAAAARAPPPRLARQFSAAEVLDDRARVVQESRRNLLGSPRRGAAPDDVERKAAAYARRISSSHRNPLDDPEVARASCQGLAVSLGLPPDAHKMGLTKVFLSHHAAEDLERRRNEAIMRHVVVLQTAQRGVAARRRLARLRAGLRAVEEATAEVEAVPLADRLGPAALSRIEEAARRCDHAGVPLHMPAVQAAVALAARLVELADRRAALAAAATEGGDDPAPLEAAMAAAAEADPAMAELKEYRACAEMAGRLRAAAEAARALVKASDAAGDDVASYTAALRAARAAGVSSGDAYDRCVRLRQEAVDRHLASGGEVRRADIDSEVVLPAGAPVEAEAEPEAAQPKREELEPERAPEMAGPEMDDDGSGDDDDDNDDDDDDDDESDGPPPALRPAPQRVKSQSSAGAGGGWSDSEDERAEEHSALAGLSGPVVRLRRKGASGAGARDAWLGGLGRGGQAARDRAEAGRLSLAGRSSSSIHLGGPRPRAAAPPLQRHGSLAALAPSEALPADQWELLSGLVEGDGAGLGEDAAVVLDAGVRAAAEDKYRTVVDAVMTQERIIHKLHERLAEAEEEADRARRLGDSLNQRMLEKVIEYGHYRAKVSGMEATYVERLRAAEARADEAAREAEAAAELLEAAEARAAAGDEAAEDAARRSVREEMLERRLEEADGRESALRAETESLQRLLADKEREMRAELMGALSDLGAQMSRREDDELVRAHGELHEARKELRQREAALADAEARAAAAAASGGEEAARLATLNEAHAARVSRLEGELAAAREELAAERERRELRERELRQEMAERVQEAVQKLHRFEAEHAVRHEALRNEAAALKKELARRESRAAEEDKAERRELAAAAEQLARAMEKQKSSGAAAASEEAAGREVAEETLRRLKELGMAERVKDSLQRELDESRAALAAAKASESALRFKTQQERVQLERRGRELTRQRTELGDRKERGPRRPPPQLGKGTLFRSPSELGGRPTTPPPPTSPGGTPRAVPAPRRLPPSADTGWRAQGTRRAQGGDGAVGGAEEDEDGCVVM